MSEANSSGRQTLISLRDISLYRDRRNVLKDINFDIRRGDFVAITGPNGGGKTTLLRIVLKLLSPSTGSVTYYVPWKLSGLYSNEKFPSVSDASFFNSSAPSVAIFLISSLLFLNTCSRCATEVEL